MFAAFPLQAL